MGQIEPLTLIIQALTEPTELTEPCTKHCTKLTGLTGLTEKQSLENKLEEPLEETPTEQESTTSRSPCRPRRQEPIQPITRGYRRDYRRGPRLRRDICADVRVMLI